MKSVGRVGGKRYVFLRRNRVQRGPHREHGQAGAVRKMWGRFQLRSRPANDGGGTQSVRLAQQGRAGRGAERGGDEAGEEAEVSSGPGAVPEMRVVPGAHGEGTAAARPALDVVGRMGGGDAGVGIGGDGIAYRDGGVFAAVGGESGLTGALSALWRRGLG